jgi:outer membrane protein TolC
VLVPNFSWNILSYGRVLNNVRFQDARMQEKVLQYQQAVLTAGREVEDALAAFVQYQLQAQRLEEGVKEAADSVQLVQAQYKEGLVDFNRVLTAQSQLVTQEDQLAVARGTIAVSLISVYRTLGGGWHVFEDRLQPKTCNRPALEPPGIGREDHSDMKIQFAADRFTTK